MVASADGDAGLPSLVSELLGALPPEHSASFREVPADDLERDLRAIVSGARTALPGIEVSEHVFVRHLAARLADPGGVSSLSSLHHEELFLACACACGDARAMATFEQRYLVAPGYLRRYGDGAFVEDVVQDLREKLFVGTADRQPRILDYAGRGSLEGWVRIAAVRHALNQRKRVQARESALAEDPIVATPDPELRAMKSEHRAAFGAVLREAMATLDPEERSLLRFYLSERLTIAEIGALYKVNRSTIVRRLAECRRKILDTCRTRLVERLHLERSDAESLMRFLRSQLDTSIVRGLVDS